MDIVLVRPDHVDQLMALYLAQVARAPHCRFIPDPARFREDVLGLRPRLRPAPQQSQVLVAEVSGTAEGFATLTTYQDEKERQAITGLFFATEAGAHALVDACEARATSDELGAFPPTHGNTIIQTYNVGWDGLSSYVPRVAGMLAQHGYTPYFRELHLITPLQPFQHGSTSLPPTITVTEPEASTSYPWSLIVLAMEGETEVGVCCYSTLAPITDASEANRTGYIWWLYVEDAYRRRGIARALMVAAMEQMMIQGCTVCWTTTTADNWAAQPLYYSLGFEVVDCSVSFQKRLRS